MQRFFEGFDKARLVLGISVFYVAALAIMVSSILCNLNNLFVKTNYTSNFVTPNKLSQSRPFERLC